MARTLLLACLAPVALATHASAQLNCGDTVPSGTKLTLTADVGTCTTGTGGITVEGGAKLDMGGHFVVCDPNDPPTGVLVGGKGAKVSRGGARGCDHAIQLDGDGGHKVEDFVATESAGDGVEIPSDKNKLRFIAAIDNGDEGVDVDGAGNKLSDVQAVDNDGDGVLVDGSGNKLARIVAADNGDDGIDLNDDDTQLKDCRSTGNLEDGIQAEGVGNTIEKCLVSGNGAGNPEDAGLDLQSGPNQAKNNVILGDNARGILVRAGAQGVSVQKNVVLGHDAADLEDENPGCAGNTWSKNRFGSSSSAGVPSPACIE
jgi:hypothetical protein